MSPNSLASVWKPEIENLKKIISSNELEEIGKIDEIEKSTKSTKLMKLTIHIDKIDKTTKNDETDENRRNRKKMMKSKWVKNWLNTRNIDGTQQNIDKTDD